MVKKLLLRTLKSFISLGAKRILHKTNGENETLEKMVNIEFVGPSGVGKTKIYSDVRSRIAGDWVFRESNPSLLTLLDDSKVFDRNRWCLLFEKVKFLDRGGYDDYNKVRLLRYFSDIVLFDLVFYNRMLDKRFFLDEGICQNFSAELMKLPERNLSELMTRRALVLVQARSSNQIVERIRARERKIGRVMAYHSGLNDEEIKRHVESEILHFESFTEKMASLGVPVCRVFSDGDISQSTEAVLDFVETIKFIH